jgi:hypothetical protein
MFVAFAGLCHFSAVVCGSSGEETANFSISTTVFAISFSQSTAAVPITANAPNLLSYFLNRSPGEASGQLRDW